jgi:3-oxoacyl-[acyl-carrier protein] reductase
MFIVTGASKGLGNAICARLIKSNKQVFGLARDTSKLQFESIDCDVSSALEVRSVAKIIRKKKFNVEGIINAAGIASMNLALTTPSSTTEKIIKTNLLGTIYCCQQFAPFLLRNKKGIIINFSTIAVSLGLKGESIYAASKAGVEGFSRAFAREMADFNIPVNCIAPGPIKTDLIRGVSENQINKIISNQIFQKQFTPDDVCDLVEMLIEDSAQTLSGQVFHVGGA